VRRRCCATGNCCRDYPRRRTLQAARNTLRAALNHARAEGLVYGNVAAYAKLPGAPEQRRAPRVWTAGEASRFLESARTDRDPFYAAYVLLIVNGLRRGEALGLVWPSVDIPAGLLRPDWQLQRVGGELIHKERATARTRPPGASVPMAALSGAALLRRGTEQVTARKAAGDRWLRTCLVFTTGRGTPVEPRNFSRSFAARCTTAGVPPIRVQDTQDTCAALLAAVGADLGVILRVLRRRGSAASASAGAGVSDDRVRNALNRVGLMLDAPQSGARESA
jgi:integrase